MQISFTSKIIPVGLSDFNKQTSSVCRDNFVDYPWTVASSRVAKDVFTCQISDCSALLLTDGEKAILMHLNPQIEKNHKFSQVIKYIENNMNVYSNNIQAILVGSKPEKESQDIFKKFEKYLKNSYIPTTILKNGKGPTHIFYRTSKDEVLVSNQTINTQLLFEKNPLKILQKSFEKVKISEYDSV